MKNKNLLSLYPFGVCFLIGAFVVLVMALDSCAAPKRTAKRQHVRDGMVQAMADAENYRARK
jgi:hypothetical protein